MSEELDDDAPADLATEVELRPCAYCGTSIHPSSHRCPECSGHVGLAWGTVHKEQFLFLFSAVCMAVGCLASWDVARPSAFDGLDTIRGTTILAFSLYGLLAGTIAVFHRRTLVWPFLIAAAEALWVGLETITKAIGSPTWEHWKAQAGPWFRTWRAIPPGSWLLTLGGALVLIAILKGLVGGFASAKSKAKATTAAGGGGAAARRRRYGGSAGADPLGGAPTPGGVDPATGQPYGTPPSPPS
jgi:hypothetical protein